MMWALWVIYTHAYAHVVLPGCSPPRRRHAGRGDGDAVGRLTLGRPGDPRPAGVIAGALSFMPL